MNSNLVYVRYWQLSTLNLMNVKKAFCDLWIFNENQYFIVNWSTIETSHKVVKWEIVDYECSTFSKTLPFSKLNYIVPGWYKKCIFMGSFWPRKRKKLCWVLTFIAKVLYCWHCHLGRSGETQQLPQLMRQFMLRRLLRVVANAAFLVWKK